MQSADAPTTPPTLTPVFDASNRWAAIRVNQVQASQPDSGLLAALDARMAAGADDKVALQLARFPWLLTADHPRQWLPAVGADNPTCKLCFLLPAATLGVADGAPDAAAFMPREVRFMLHGEPGADAPAPTQHFARGIDMGEGFNGNASLLLKKHPGPHLAWNIVDAVAHRQCVSAGFHWFAGRWPLHFVEAQAAQNDTSRNTLLKLLGLVANDAGANELEVLLKQDPNLSFQLLKLVNSVSFGLTHKIASFKQAITVLGRRQLQRWLQLLIYAGHHGNGGVSILFGFAARRAAFMEQASAVLGGNQDEKDQAFMVGLFSLLDVLFAAPLAKLIPPLNLEDDVTRALVAREGRLGNLLDLAIGSESAPDAALYQRLESLGIKPEVFVDIQLQALAWAVQISGEME